MRLTNAILLIIFAGAFMTSCSKEKLSAKTLKLPLNKETAFHFEVEIETSNPNIEDDLASKGIDKGVIILPKGYSNTGNPVKLMMYCHGGGGFVNDRTSEAESDVYCKYFVSLGYAVLEMNGIPESIVSKLKIDGGRSVGNFLALRSYVEGYGFVFDKFNLDKNGCYLFANSNGGLISMNLGNLTTLPIAAGAGICPLLSIELNTWFLTNSALNGGGGEFSSYQNRANIIRLYGMKDVSTQAELNSAKYEKGKVGVYDPFDYLMNQVTETFRIPYKIFQPKDDVAVKYLLTKQLVDEMNRRGGDMILRSFETGGHTVEPQKGIVGTFEYQLAKYPLTPTVLEVAKYYESKGGYAVKYSN